MKKLLLILPLILFTTLPSFASYDFVVDNIYYNILSSDDQTCEVTRGSTNYSGDVIIPSTVTYNGKTYTVASIRYGAFSICSDLTSITIPNSVTTIEHQAFQLCSNLTSITIPNSVTTIGIQAFAYCTSLTSIVIPNSVTAIGDAVFTGCRNLKSITGKYASDDNRCLIVDGSLNSFAPAELTTYTIPSSVTTIGNYAFQNCFNLTSINIPNSVTTIGNYAFQYCENLTSIVIPNSVTTIGSSAFAGCTSLPVENDLRYADTYLVEAVDKSLNTYNIKDGTKWIGSNAFNNCSDLTSIDIPNSVTTIENFAFAACSSLKSFTGKFASDDHRCLIIDGVLRSFAPADLTTYTIPNSVTIVSDYAFNGYADLTSIDIPNSVTTIGEGAFRYCENLTSITIPNSVTTIGEGAFYNCSNLTSITIPNSVTTIGNSAFGSCESLTSITLPNSVNTIGYETFSFCTSLTSIVIPNSVTTIGNNAFLRCSSLTSIDIPNSVTTIDNSAFSYCSSLTSIDIPNSVTTIGNNAFLSCSSLTSIDIPNSVTTIGGWAFANCSNLKSITGKFASNDNRCLIVDGVLNSFAPAELTTYTIPSSVTTIGNYAFQYCENLTSINIPNSVTTIGNSAFGYCSKLTSITIPNSVTTIGDWAFSYCFELSSVVIGNSVTTIKYGAFSNCTYLSEITSLAVNPPSVLSESFSGFPISRCPLKVPTESVEAYKAAEVWKSFRKIVALTEEELQALPVESISATTSLTTPAYNLRGQRVGTTYKGIVVRNRHKVILK